MVKTFEDGYEIPEVEHEGVGIERTEHKIVRKEQDIVVGNVLQEGVLELAKRIGEGEPVKR